MKPNQKRSALFVAIATLLASPSLLAQEQSQPQSAQALDSVQVKGVYIPEPMLDTSEVASFITQEDLERTGDSTAAEALTRVSGLSMSNDKFVFVRGLNERYTAAMLNGSPLPSTEPMQRVVPLDLFPTDVLQGITVQKTYSAKYPGEFGGGVIDLQSLSIPRENFLSVTVGTGGNSATTFEKGLTYYGSDTDFWGYDDGTRKMPGELKQAIATGHLINADGGHFSLDEVKRIGRSLQNANLNVLQQKNSIDPDVNFGASGGYSAEIGEDTRLGFVGVAGFENKWRTRFGVQRQVQFLPDGNLDTLEDFDFLSTRNDAKVNLMFGTGLEVGNHRFGLTSLYVHDTTKVARSAAGADPYGHFSDVRWDGTSWFERTLLSHQLSGSHGFGEYKDFKIDWRLAHSRAKRDVPYEKRIGYRMDAEGYWMYDGNGIRNSTDFSRVDDKVVSGGIDLTWRLPLETREVILSGGVSHSDNDRNAELRTFGFMAPSNLLPFYNRYQRVDYLFSDYNISQDLLRFIERTPQAGQAAYDAKLKVDAAYLQAEIEFNPTLRATIGGRHERATQWVRPYSLHVDSQPVAAVEPLRNSYFLPALTLTWNFAENQQIRFGASETLARPQFREMAPQEYTDPDSDRKYIGNPYLADSKLRNLDVRYEWFFNPGEHLTVGLFHKSIDNPVESSVYWTGSNFYQTYFNAPRARLHGLEAELKKYLSESFDLWGDEMRLFLGANYTWSKSRLSARDGDTVQLFMHPQPVDARLFVNDGEVMQGQSEHIGNLQFGLESPSSRSQAMLVINHVSDRVSARTPADQPDYREKPGTGVDLVLRKGITLGGTELTLSFSGRNLLDTDYREYQQQNGTNVDVHRYKRGASYSFGLSASF